MPADRRPPNRSTLGGNVKKKSKSKSSNSNPLLLWGGIGGVVLLVVAIVIVVVSRSGPPAEVPVAAPNTEPTAPSVIATSSDLPKPKAKAFSERAAAEWVVSVGGRVRVLEPGRASFDVYDSTALPKGDFHIETIGLDGIDAVNDEQVEQL